MNTNTRTLYFAHRLCGRTAAMALKLARIEEPPPIPYWMTRVACVNLAMYRMRKYPLHHDVPARVNWLHWWAKVRLAEQPGHGWPWPTLDEFKRSNSHGI